MNINNSGTFRCLVAIEQGGFTFEAAKIYFLKMRSDTGISIYRGCGGVGNFTLSECSDHFIPVVQVKCTMDYKENEVTLYPKGAIFYVADSGSDEYALYSGSDTDPTTITNGILTAYFKEVT